MSPQKYSNASRIKLEDMISTGRFRLVMSQQFEEPHGISELPVQIELSDKTSKLLSYKVPWDGWLYGFVRANEVLKAINGRNGENHIQMISLHDWEDQFLLVIETELTEMPYFVASDEVVELLEGCLRPPVMD